MSDQIYVGDLVLVEGDWFAWVVFVDVHELGVLKVKRPHHGIAWLRDYVPREDVSLVLRLAEIPDGWSPFRMPLK